MEIFKEIVNFIFKYNEVRLKYYFCALTSYKNRPTTKNVPAQHFKNVVVENLLAHFNV